MKKTTVWVRFNAPMRFELKEGFRGNLEVPGWGDFPFVLVHWKTGKASWWQAIDEYTGALIAQANTRKECLQRTEELIPSLEDVVKTDYYREKRLEFESWLQRNRRYENG